MRRGSAAQSGEDRDGGVGGRACATRVETLEAEILSSRRSGLPRPLTEPNLRASESAVWIIVSKARRSWSETSTEDSLGTRDRRAKSTGPRTTHWGRPWSSPDGCCDADPHRHWIVAVSFSDPTAEADLRTYLEVRMINAAGFPNTTLIAVGHWASHCRACWPRSSAFRGFTCVRYCDVAPASSPHALADHAVASGSQLPATGSVRDLHPQWTIHVQRTRASSSDALRMTG